MYTLSIAIVQLQSKHEMLESLVERFPSNQLQKVTRSAETTHHHCGHVHNTITIAPPPLIQLSTISTLSYAEHHNNYLRASENAQGFATSEEANKTALLILVVLYAYQSITYKLISIIEYL